MELRRVVGNVPGEHFCDHRVLREAGFNGGAVRTCWMVYMSP